MKTFAEFAKKADAPTAGFPTFAQVKEGVEGKCISESMRAKLNEICEALCEDMKSCHEDETSYCAEDYHKECMESLKEMEGKLTQQCESYMSALH